MAQHKPHDDQTSSVVARPQGTMVHHYRILEKIGAGGMGDVYQAEDTKLKRKVALKFISEERTRDQAVRQQFTKEAQAAARLQHPNIITVHEVNEYEGVPFICMAYVEGLSLKDTADQRSLSIADIIDIGIQIARGLTAAHEGGISHRDLKPGNLMMDGTGTVKILDFGLAVLSDVQSSNDSDRTATIHPFANQITGTISYMAPEQLLGQEIGSQADLFAFGIVMYELIAGEHPFTAPSAQEISARILRDTPADLSAERPNVPYDLSRIVSRCLKKRPDKRFQTARDVVNELEELSDQLKRNVAVTVIDDDTVKRDLTLSEKTFSITTDLVRRLSHKDPQMIGSSLAYLDNGVSSDVLIMYVHPLGADHEHFSEALQLLPVRAVAVSVFGFDRNARLRLPLALHDHSILIQALIKDLCTILRPRHLVLAGHSSGADHILHLVTSGLIADMTVSGVLALGCNLHVKDCFASGKLAGLTAGDERQIVSTIKQFSQMATSLPDWLITNEYLVRAFMKFGIQTEPLRQYAADIYAPFKDGTWEQFPKWYTYCLKNIPHVQFVIDTNGYPALDMLMQEHLENNILGDDFQADTIARAPCSHGELGETARVLQYSLEFLERLNARAH